MSKISGSAMPIGVVAPIVASVLAVGVLWVSPAVGLALFGAVVLGGWCCSWPAVERPGWWLR